MASLISGGCCDKSLWFMCDPFRRTGRTTRSLIAAAETKKPKNGVVLFVIRNHDQEGYCRNLADKLGLDISHLVFKTVDFVTTNPDWFRGWTVISYWDHYALGIQ